jgi:hypothetical protein
VCAEEADTWFVLLIQKIADWFSEILSGETGTQLAARQ